MPFPCRTSRTPSPLLSTHRPSCSPARCAPPSHHTREVRPPHPPPPPPPPSPPPRPPAPPFFPATVTAVTPPSPAFSRDPPMASAVTSARASVFAPTKTVGASP